ncbi:MAG: FadR family transcriptional regulator [Rhodospirillaceae bacterium]|nr:FadR family transcriptional regulator [Rhodospirillaceae bacterium]MBL6942377.1 FadR family transcriptional regulator [Rhodospirillales bacterium]
MNSALNGTSTPEPAKTGAASIAARLRQAILNGEYAFQARLPAERDLAEFFDASRGTIRSALQQLEETGLLARRVGSGTFVIYNAAHQRPTSDENNIVEFTSPLELIEGRLAIEPRMVKLAGLNASNRDLEVIRDALNLLENCNNDRDCFSRADEEFHLALAAASHNRLIYWMYCQLNEVRSHAQWDGMKNSIINPQIIADYNRQHRDVYMALVNRDIERAENIIIEHLEDARQHLLSARST